MLFLPTHVDNPVNRVYNFCILSFICQKILILQQLIKSVSCETLLIVGILSKCSTCNNANILILWLHMKTFTSKTQKIGEIGEKLAKMFLMKHGFTIIELNYTRKFGEIDIVAKKGKVWHFIEVKSVSRVTLDDVSSETSGFRPEENMHEKKIQRFVRTVDYYRMSKNLDDSDFQIDLALVYIDQVRRAGKVRLMENVV